MKRQVSFFLGTVLFIFATLLARAQQESPLASSVESTRHYGSNYSELVRGALPKANAAALSKMLVNVRRAAAAEKPLTIADPRELEKTFGLRERGEPDSTGYLDVGEAVYKVDTKRQRSYLVRRYTDVQPVARKEFEPELKAIRSAHQELAERVGVPRQEVFFADFREILSETDGHPELEKGVKGEIQSAGAVSTFVRAVGGILVEGSYLRMSSIDAKRLEMLDAHWPVVRLSEVALKRGLRSPAESLPSITKRIASESKGQAVSVRMAIVLRPVESSKTMGAAEFVPSLKVGVVPQSVKAENGYRTDAGEIFFVDLVRGAPAFADPAALDTSKPRSAKE